MTMTRKDYMAADHSDRAVAWQAHRAYYSQFINESTIETVVRHIGGDRLLGSTDRYLNDIPLGEWDALCGARQRGQEIQWFGGPSFPYERRWQEVDDFPSLSSLVCIAKEAARQWIERQKETSDVPDRP